jgi:hypothetical protein
VNFLVIVKTAEKENYSQTSADTFVSTYKPHGFTASKTNINMKQI